MRAAVARGDTAAAGEAREAYRVFSTQKCADKQRMLVKRCCDTRPCSVLPDVGELLDAAFNGQAPGGWCGTHLLSAVFKTEDPANLDHLPYIGGIQCTGSGYMHE